MMSCCSATRLRLFTLAEELQNVSKAYRTLITTRGSSRLGRRVVARRPCREIRYEGRVSIERSQSVASTT